MDKNRLLPKNLLMPFILITSMFFMWGLANNMTDTLLAAFKKIMSMTDFQTSWIQIAFYGSYFCLALPAALLIRRYTYKTGLLIGLGMFITGALLFYPASHTMAYGHFLVALFILAGGLSILETTANPYILELGAEETSIRRLNLAQSFNPIGSITGVWLSKFFILDNLQSADAASRAGMEASELQLLQQQELEAVMGPYVGVALLLLVIWLVMLVMKMPTAAKREGDTHWLVSLRRLLQNRNYRWGVTAQFFYVGAQIGVWSYTIRYIMQELGVNESQGANYYLGALALFMVSRFAFTGLLKYFSAIGLLTGSAVAAMFFTLIVIGSGGYVGAIALVAISGCMSLMFPTIFGLAVRGTGDDRKLAGSGLIMAILGGAVMTAIQGQISDYSGRIELSFVVPLLCFFVVVIFGLISKKQVS